jgi:hypothetical protein
MEGEPMQCIANKNNGEPCGNTGERERNGYCHIHDPKGLFRLQNGKRRKRTTKNSFIYLFDIGFDGLYKIGHTRDWKQRLSALGAANPRLLAVAVIEVEDRHIIEKEIHQSFDGHRLHRELFKLPDPLVVVRLMEEYGKIVYRRDMTNYLYGDRP